MLQNARPGSVNLVCEGPQTLDFLFTSLVRILRTCVIELLGSSEFDVQLLTDADMQTLERVFLSFGIRIFVDRASSVAIRLRKDALSDYRLVVRIPSDMLIVVRFEYASLALESCNMTAMRACRA